MAVGKKEPIAWEAYEYAYHEKTSDWYWAVGITAFSTATASILFNNVLFAVVILLAFVILMIHAKRKPSLLLIKLDERGLFKGHIHHHFSSLDSFWVEDRYGNPKLILKSKKRVLPYIVIPINDVDAEEVRSHIKRHVPEEEHHEPLARQLMEYFGF